MSALKPAEDGDGLVLRIWNTAERCVRARVAVGFDLTSVEAIDLLERRVALLSPRGRAVEFDVCGKRITTLRLRSAPR